MNDFAIFTEFAYGAVRNFTVIDVAFNSDLGINGIPVIGIHLDLKITDQRFYSDFIRISLNNENESFTFRGRRRRFWSARRRRRKFVGAPPMPG